MIVLEIQWYPVKALTKLFVICCQITVKKYVTFNEHDPVNTILERKMLDNLQTLITIVTISIKQDRKLLH